MEHPQPVAYRDVTTGEIIELADVQSKAPFHWLIRATETKPARWLNARNIKPVFRRPPACDARAAAQVLRFITERQRG